MVGVLVFMFGAAVWFGSVMLPRANPWTMGEVAFTRLLVLNAAMFGGSILAILLTAIGWFRIRLGSLLFAALPCVLYVIMVVMSFGFQLLQRT